MDIPDLFRTKVIGCFGDEGNEWLDTLQTLVQTFVEKWNIKVEGPVTNLSYNYVLRAKDSEEKPVILKLGVPNFDFQNEILTLEAYGGRGCVELLKADPQSGAMLLNQLVPGIMLSDEQDEETVMQQFIQ